MPFPFRIPRVVFDLLLVTLLVFIGFPVLNPDNMETQPAEDPLVFKVEWMDPQAETVRHFLFSFYPSENSVEMYDVKLKRIFLSRIFCDTVNEKDLFLGNTVLVFARRLQITDYGNESTQSRLKSWEEVTLAMIKPDGLKNMGNIIDKMETAGFIIGKAKMTRLTVQQAQLFYDEHKERPFFPDLTTYITSGPIVALELRKSDAVNAWRQLLGPTDCARARLESPDSIRALYGKDKTENAAHGSDSTAAAKREISFFFPSDNKEKQFAPRVISQQGSSPTCCLIKPHAVKEGLAGKIIAEIQARGFNISGLCTFHLKYEHAEEFYEIYKGVVQDYTGMVKQLSSGLSIAMEISHADMNKNVVSQFRELVGPSDPELARTLRPESLRAKFGRKTVEENAIHCTDLPEDGKLEVDYFFNILQSS